MIVSPELPGVQLVQHLFGGVTIIEVILKAIKKGHEGTIQLDNQKAPKNSLG